MRRWPVKSDRNTSVRRFPPEVMSGVTRVDKENHE